MTPSIPRIGIVGAGRLSSGRIYPYIGAAGAQIAGVCDQDSSLAERNALHIGGQPFTDMNVMLREVQPDGVIICIGPEAHAKLSVQALEAGFPVYTEKPPAATAEEAITVARTARRTGLLCTTAFKKRYTMAASRARKWIEGYPPEDLLSMSIDYCSGYYPSGNAHRTFLLDFAIHIIDLVPFFFGDVAEVFAFSKGEHAYAVSLHFTNGAVGSLNLNDGRSFRIPTEEIELTAKGGNFMTIHNSSIWRVTENEKPSEWREPPTFTSRGDSGHETGHLAELEDFVSALREKRTTTRSDIHQSCKTMILYEAIKTSAETGQIVRPNYENLP